MPRRRRGVRLEMTALMDVMFLVLVFFIYSVFDMTMHRGVKVDLPGAKGAEEKGDRVVVTILPDDSLQLDGEPLARPELLARVAALVAGADGAEEPPALIVSGDRAASLGAGVSLLAELKAAGVERVSFQVSGAPEP
ncbi:MAG: biopolymer transporter ExbD [Kiritimatiellae bacterium]|nr:biopolymer transporter ExbD [Kiritimatiellia bacterium]